jgi:hypothetical protein
VTLKVGEGIIQKAPMALLGLALITLTMLFIDPVFWPVGLQGIGFGGLSALLLLGYWQGKGGSLFILSLLTPLVHIVFAHVPNVLALGYAITGFFTGFALLLAGYGFLNRKKKGSA